MPAELLVRTLRHVWNQLTALQVPAAIMGGIAVTAWKHSRATHDIDLLVGVTPGELNRVLDTLRASGLRPKREPAVLAIGDQQIVQFWYEPPGSFMEIQVDLLLANSPFQKEALARGVSVELPECKDAVRVVSCEDLILFKLLAGRIIDRADAAALLRANRARLDVNYLACRVGELELEDAWREIWDEAVPGEPPAALAP